MLYLILLLPLALAALSLIRNDRARTVILAAGQALLLALLIDACTLGDMATPVWHMTADLTFSLRLDPRGAPSPFLRISDADGGGGAGRGPGGGSGDSVPVL